MQIHCCLILCSSAILSTVNLLFLFNTTIIHPPGSVNVAKLFNLFYNEPIQGFTEGFRPLAADKGAAGYPALLSPVREPLPRPGGNHESTRDNGIILEKRGILMPDNDTQNKMDPAERTSAADRRPDDGRDIRLERITTEQSNPRTQRLDEASALEIARMINREDEEVPKAIGKILPDIARAMSAIARRLTHGGRLLYVGSGTSGRLGVLDAAECPPTFGTDPELVKGIIAGGTEAIFRAREGVEDSPEQGRKDMEAEKVTNLDVVVGLTASGRTPYVLGALDYAHEKGAYTVSVTCSREPEVADHSDLPLIAVTGPEVLTGSTRMKAGTAQKLILNMISTGTMILSGKVYNNLMVDVQCTNRKLQARARRMVMTVTDCDYGTAGRLLEEARGNAKTAIFMHLGGVPYEEADRILKEHGGFLKKALRSLQD